MPIDYVLCRDLTENAFNQAEAELLSGERPESLFQTIDDALDVIFLSRTQAYREAFTGCILARFNDKSIDITKPYVSQGEEAFNGRTLDEQVVNPILQQRRIPASRGPYLSVFRRSVEFNLATREGVRDKRGYDAFLRLLAYTAAESDDETLLQLLQETAYRFVRIREDRDIPLNRIQRMSLSQTTSLVRHLLATPSGGRLPMLIVVAALQVVKGTIQRMSLSQTTSLVRHLLATPSGGRLPMLIVVAALQVVKGTFNLDWDIAWEGINVADAASGLSGDIVVSRNGQTIIAAEVTEREVDRNRVVATFNNKIGPNPMDDYLFFVRSEAQNSEALQQVRQYFAQGHEINFVVVEDWVGALLATAGREGRSRFTTELLVLLGDPDVPTTLRVAWNDLTDRVISEG